MRKLLIILIASIVVLGNNSIAQTPIKVEQSVQRDIVKLTSFKDYENGDRISYFALLQNVDHESLKLIKTKLLRQNSISRVEFMTINGSDRKKIFIKSKGTNINESLVNKLLAKLF